MMIVPIPVAANAKAEAKKHFKTGNALYLAEDYAGAAVEFEESVKLYPTQNGLFNLANSYKAIHRYSKAQKVLDRMEKDFGNQMDEEMRTKVGELDSEIRSLVCKLDIEVQPHGATIRVNGEKRGESPLGETLLLSPGEYEISVSLDGYQTAKKKVRLVSGSNRMVGFELQRSQVDISGPESEDLQETESEQNTSKLPSVVLKETNASRLSPLFWVTMGVTVASATTMIVFWSMYDQKVTQNVDKYNDYNDMYGNEIQSTNDPEYISQTEAGEEARLFWGLTLGFTIGTGVLVAATLIIMTVDLSRTKRFETVEVSASPSGLVLSF